MSTTLFLTLMGLFAAYFGGALVSFLTVVIWRARRGENCLGRSRCACGRPLKWYENVPLIGGMVNRAGGGSKCCGSKVPGFIIFTEGIGALGLGYAGVAISNAMIDPATTPETYYLPVVISVASLLLASLIVYIADKKHDPNPTPMRAKEA